MEKRAWLHCAIEMFDPQPDPNADPNGAPPMPQTTINTRDLLKCTPWQNGRQRDGLCGSVTKGGLPVKCDYHSVSLNTQCVERAGNTALPVPLFQGRKCLFVGDAGERTGMDFKGWPTG